MAEKGFWSFDVVFPDPGVFYRFLNFLCERNVSLGNIELLEVIGEVQRRRIELGWDKDVAILEDWLSENGCEFRVEDELFEFHEGGKLEVVVRPPWRGALDLRKIYTPGVAQIAKRLMEEPEAYRKYTWVGRTCAVVTDGTAVLGLGNVGVRAAMPVMEGKAALIRLLGGVNAVPLLIRASSPDEFIETVVRISDTYGMIQLEDIAAPHCFYVENELQKKLDIPVFHDDQHGTAVVVLAALINSLRLKNRKPGDVKVVVCGAGAAGTAVSKLLLSWGVENVVVVDKKGVICKDRGDLSGHKLELAKITNPENLKGTLADALKGADILIGVSSPRVVTPDMVSSMNEKPVVFALANPEPEIAAEEAYKAGAFVYLDGRSLNNALAFPGIVRGALLGNVRIITSEIKIRAAQTIADYAWPRLVPAQQDVALHQKVAEAVGCPKEAS